MFEEWSVLLVKPIRFDIIKIVHTESGAECLEGLVSLPSDCMKDWQKEGKSRVSQRLLALSKASPPGIPCAKKPDKLSHTSSTWKVDGDGQ